MPPVAAYARAPLSLAPTTAGTQPNSRASARQASMAGCQLSRCPTGSADASDTPAMTR